MPKLVSLNRPSPDIELNSDGGIFNFLDMELGPVTKLDKRSTTTLKKKKKKKKKIYDDITVIFPIYG